MCPSAHFKSCSPFSSWVPIQLGTTVLDRAMAKITIEELTFASNTWQQTYMSTVVMVGVVGSVETNHDETPSINVPLVTTKNIVIPHFGHMSKGIDGIATSLQLPSPHDCRTSSRSVGHMGVMATSTYGDFYPALDELAWC